MFEPRRKLNSLPSDRDEGILPYDPQIKLIPIQAINYYRSVFDVEKFHVAVRTGFLGTLPCKNYIQATNRTLTNSLQKAVKKWY